MRKLALLIIVFTIALSCKETEKKTQLPNGLSNEVLLERGDSGEAVKYLKRILLSRGYISTDDSRSLTYDERTEKALKKFQAENGLDSTGKLDSTSFNILSDPKCGFEASQEFVLGGSRWQNSKLRYRFANYSNDLQVIEVRNAIQAAFDSWATVTNLTFVEVQPAEAAEINILFAEGAHGDAGPFDGPGGVLAHAFLPPPLGNGHKHYDEAERWTIVNPKPFWTQDLESVAVHEIGHSLGLDHSEIPGAVMFEFISGINRQLHQDDIDGIQSLYPPSLGKSWEIFPTGGAKDITVLDSNTIYIVGTDNGIYKWNGSDWDRMKGGASRITVGPAGEVWIVGSDSNIYRWNVDDWVRVAGGASDISIGTDGSVWMTGTDNRIYKRNGNNWEPLNQGGGYRITIDGNGLPWIVGTDNRIYRWDGAQWLDMNGGGVDISIHGEEIWIVGTDGRVYRWTNESWIPTDGGASAIDLADDGRPYIVGTDNRIYQRK